MTREQRLTMADDALNRAASLAHDAEEAARSFYDRDKTQQYAAVGALWASIARTHTEIAATLPETEHTDG